jgi:hypothetical protein
MFSHEQFHFRAEVGQVFKYSTYFEWYFITSAFCVLEEQLHEFLALSFAIYNSVYITVIHTKF